MEFINDDFLLNSDTAKELYHGHAEGMPIVDYHNHLSPREIYEDRRYENMTEVWLGGDHYKWRAMRGNGVPEELITGTGADPYKRFAAWADTVPQLFGNPLYHWTALELKRYFDIDTPLKKETAREIYDECNEKLKDPEFSARGLLVKMNVEELCTTDDPADDLRYHKKLREEETRFHVRPTFRPERAMNLLKPDYHYYIDELSMVSELRIYNYNDLLKALTMRLDYFCENGCRITDHSLEGGIYREASELEVARIFEHRLNDGVLTKEQELKFKTRLLKDLAVEYRKRDLVMQLHIGAMRNNNIRLYDRLGPDVGFDSQDDMNYARELSRLLGEMDEINALPKTIIYCLNPKDNEMLGSMIGNFQDGSCPGKIQLGPAWWFCDHKRGMIRQMETLCDYGVFSRFTGMLTDSRSFLSFPRHEYFRRILCDFVGDAVERGEYPRDMEFLGQMIENICCNNAKQYLNI